MAVAPTGAIYKALKFDNVSSRTYGVYITGEAVYNAPKRDVEMITIPGRSGSFALDNGRFENITVTYPAGIFAETEADFREAISDFRNFLCSRKGYVRLQDEYNPNEYRMAVYKSGLEVEPAMLKAGEFEITFDCKPQRWLTSGETAVSVTSGDTIINPTLFEASPLLVIEGEGAIELGDYEINLENVDIGTISIGSQVASTTNTVTETLTIGGQLNSNDEITVKAPTQPWYTATYKWSNSLGPKGVNVTSCTGVDGCRAVGTGTGMSVFFPDETKFLYGTSETKTITAVGNFSFYNRADIVITITVSLAYNGSDTLTLTATHSESPSTPTYTSYNQKSYIGDTTAYSTKPANFTLYCDCEIGEFYRIENDEIISMNQVNSFGSQLPTLPVGTTTITYDNTITSLKIAPRWWRV